jgi:hypothetical protein
MLRRLALLPVLAVFVTPLLAQSVPTLRGTLRDSLGRPIARAEVAHRSAKTYTDSAGNFSLSPVPPGRISIRFIKDGILLGSMLAEASTDTTDGVFLEAIDDRETPRTLTGVVVDSAGKPIRDATVDVITALRDVRTDTLGRFTFRNLPAKRHILRVRRVGYAPTYASADLTEGTSVRARIVVRQFAGQNLGLVVVRSDRGTLRLRGFLQRAAKPSGWGRIITGEELATRVPLRTTDAMLGIPGVRINYDARGQGFLVGRGGCLMAVFINGSPAPQLPSSGIDDLVATGDLVGIEVYNGIAGVPLELMSGVETSACGTIGIWTK